VKIVTWNVNSLRVRLPQVLEWVDRNRPDVLCLQETKLEDAQFPEQAIRDAGYHVAYAGQKTYNGVATLSLHPMDGVITDLPGFEDVQRRVLGVQIDGVRVLNLYVPNGAEVGSEKYRYKLEWLDHLVSFLHGRKRDDRLVVVGDFNIAPTDDDVHDPELWRGSVLVSEAERERFTQLLQVGLHDAFRKFEQPADSYTWWDYRAAAFRRNNGLRIDHILCSRDLLDACRSCSVDREPRAGERPSDHAPVIAEFDI